MWVETYDLRKTSGTRQCLNSKGRLFMAKRWFKKSDNATIPEFSFLTPFVTPRIFHSNCLWPFLWGLTIVIYLKSCMNMYDMYIYVYRYTYIYIWHFAHTTWHSHWYFICIHSYPNTIFHCININVENMLVCLHLEHWKHRSCLFSLT